MSELLGGDETLFSLWPDHFLHRPPLTGTDWQNNSSPKVDQQFIPVPIVLLDDGRVAFKNDDGNICLLDGLQGLNGEDALSHLPSVEDAAAELPSLDAAIKSLLSQTDLDPELALVGAEMPDLSEKDLPLPAPSPSPVDDDLKALMSFRCQYCSFSSADVPRLMDHVKTQHQQSQPEVPSEQSCDSEEELENIDSAQEVLPGAGVKATEQIVYLCSECEQDFSSIAECRDHMINDHDMVFEKKDKEGEVLEREEVMARCSPSPPVSSPPPPPPPPPSPPRKAPAVTKASPQPLVKTSARLVQPKQPRPKINDSDPDYEVKAHKCPELFCSFKFRTQEAMQMHVACHAKEHSHRFVCTHCTTVFVRWGQCALHLWNQHQVDVDLYPCTVCSTYRTTTRKKLQCHMRIHGDARPFKCTVCDKGFKQSPQLANHMVSVHHKNRGVGNKWYMPQKCEICQKIYADIKCLKKHMQAVHSKLKPYKCQICGHMSARKAMLTTHMRQHTGEKPFACKHCDYKTGDHNSLRKHVMRHTGVRPYNCPHCSYSSIQSTSFKWHVSSKHPGQAGVFACVECCFVTISELSFERHINDHKLNLIQSEVEVFPENVAAAHLVYRSLGASPSRLHCDVTRSTTSLDRMKQTITISIPSQESAVVTDDEDTSHCYLSEDVMDTGGITIPAEPEPQPCSVSCTSTDDDTRLCYLPEDVVDTGGITIPAEPEPQPCSVSCTSTDDDTRLCYLPEDVVDTGGITIPAEPEPQPAQVSCTKNMALCYDTNTQVSVLPETERSDSHAQNLSLNTINSL